MKRDYTDAEFEVIREPPKPAEPDQWNGLGIPPQWATWGWVERIVFVIVWPIAMGAVFLFHHWLWVNWVLAK